MLPKWELFVNMSHLKRDVYREQVLYPYAIIYGSISAMIVTVHNFFVLRSFSGSSFNFSGVNRALMRTTSFKISSSR